MSIFVEFWSHFRKFFLGCYDILQNLYSMNEEPIIETMVIDNMQFLFT